MIPELGQTVRHRRDELWNLRIHDDVFSDADEQSWLHRKR